MSPSTFTLNPHTYTLHFPADDSYQAEWDVFEPKPIIRSTVERRLLKRIGNRRKIDPDFGTLNNFLGFDNISIAPCYESHLQ